MRARRFARRGGGRGRRKPGRQPARARVFAASGAVCSYGRLRLIASAPEVKLAHWPRPPSASSETGYLFVLACALPHYCVVTPIGLSRISMYLSETYHILKLNTDPA